MRKLKPALVQCGGCESCEGSTILKYLVIDKQSQTVIDRDEVFRFKCNIFGYIAEDDVCYNLRPRKEPTVQTEWVEQ